MRSFSSPSSCCNRLVDITDQENNITLLRRAHCESGCQCYDFFFFFLLSSQSKDVWSLADNIIFHAFASPLHV